MMQTKKELTKSEGKEIEETTPSSNFVTSTENLLEEASDNLSTLDNCNELLMSAMKSQNVKDIDAMKQFLGCAKEIRENLKLKLSLAKFLQSEINKGEKK